MYFLYFGETKNFKATFDQVNDNQDVKYYNFKRGSQASSFFIP